MNENRCKRCQHAVMIDQYGEPVPPLSALPCELPLDDDELRQYANAAWYDVEVTPNPGDEPITVLMCPDKHVDCPDEDIYITWDGRTSKELGGIVVEIMRVNDVLKRWSEEDGFYHA